MKQHSILGVVIFAIFLAILTFFLLGDNRRENTQNVVENPSVEDQQTSDGTLSFEFPLERWGLAVRPEQILVRPYIPPCGEDFMYCLYYIGEEFTGTNFESAGIRIQKRSDLVAEDICLNTPPEGFASSTMPNDKVMGNLYASSVFSVGDAGAGHVAEGRLYRLYYRSQPTCYEFEARIGYTQFSNYPEGEIREFSNNDRDTLQGEIEGILEAVALPSGARDLFPS